MLKGFRDFILRGNVIELAVAVVIGTAFNAVVSQFTKSFVQPLINLAGGGGAMGGRFHVNGQYFDWGAFVSALIFFLITAAVVYFVFIAPMNLLADLRRRGQAPPETPPTQEELLTEIRDLLRAQRGDANPRYDQSGPRY